MPVQLSPNERKAFTLIELIIVILIISLTGFLLFSEIKKQEEKEEVLDPTTLPMALRKSFPGHQEIELFCINKTTQCYTVQGSDINSYEGLVQLGTNVETYKVDENNQLTKIDEMGRIKDEKITFRFTLHANGSSTQMVIANDQGIYYLPSYFSEAQKVDSLDEAQELWIKEEYDLGDKGNYY